MGSKGQKRPLVAVPGQVTRVAAGAALWVAGLLAACGGGGSDPVPPDQPQGDTGVSVGPPPLLGPDSFQFAPTAALSSLAALEAQTGGSLFAAWNPTNPATALQPGMKVMFFGQAQGCTAGSQGPLAPFSDARLAQVAPMTGQSAVDPAKAALRWTPSGAVAHCDAATQSKLGASSVFLNADNALGHVALLTSSGVQADGQVSFFGPYPAGGQNGLGNNAYITGSFVNFRQAWGVADPMQPWTGTASARLRSQQSLGTASVGGATTQVQVKQQMMATFLNKTCQQTMSGKPCQIQYLLNTAIVRAGVTDWSQVAWFQKGDVWFDPVQSGIPIVDGPIYAPGIVTVENRSSLPLFASQGSSTQHASFADRTFDVTISFEQLINVVRITVARTLDKGLDQVTDADVAAMWGDAWQDRAAWVLLSANVAQEVHNPESQRRAEIAGAFRTLFVGPQP